MSVNYDLGLLFSVFGDGSILKTLGISIVIMFILISAWMAMSSDTKKIIFAIFSAIGFGFLIGGLSDHQNDK